MKASLRCLFSLRLTRSQNAHFAHNSRSVARHRGLRRARCRATGASHVLSFLNFFFWRNSNKRDSSLETATGSLFSVSLPLSSFLFLFGCPLLPQYGGNAAFCPRELATWPRLLFTRRRLDTTKIRFPLHSAIYYCYSVIDKVRRG